MGLLTLYGLPSLRSGSSDSALRRVPSLVPLLAVRQSSQKANPELIKVFDIQDFLFLQIFFCTAKKWYCSLYTGCLHCVQARRAPPSVESKSRSHFFTQHAVPNKKQIRNSAIFAIPDFCFLRLSGIVAGRTRGKTDNPAAANIKTMGDLRVRQRDSLRELVVFTDTLTFGSFARSFL